MNWKRERPGVYVAGPYRVERGLVTGPVWLASGPGVERGDHLRKDGAQNTCEAAAEQRALGFAVPVVGDAVMFNSRRGQITSTQPCWGDQVLYCIKFARGRRVCVFRNEFSVVVP